MTQIWIDVNLCMNENTTIMTSHSTSAISSNWMDHNILSSNEIAHPKTMIACTPSNSASTVCAGSVMPAIRIDCAAAINRRLLTPIPRCNLNTHPHGFPTHGIEMVRRLERGAKRSEKIPAWENIFAEIASHASSKERERATEKIQTKSDSHLKEFMLDTSAAHSKWVAGVRGVECIAPK